VNVRPLRRLVLIKIATCRLHGAGAAGAAGTEAAGGAGEPAVGNCECHLSHGARIGQRLSARPLAYPAAGMCRRAFICCSDIVDLTMTADAVHLGTFDNLI
jgi:hypothetical protein